MTQEDIKKRVMEKFKQAYSSNLLDGDPVDNDSAHLNSKFVWEFIEEFLPEALDTVFKEWKQEVKMRKSYLFKSKRHTTECYCVYIGGKRRGGCLPCMQENMYQQQKARNKAVDDLNKKLQELGE